MPQLDWDEYAFIECLEVLPEVEQHVRQTFTVVQPDVTLILTVWHLESVVAIDVTHTASDSPLISFVLIVRGSARYLKGPTSECLEFVDVAIVPSRFSYREYEQKRVDLYDPKQMPGLDTLRVFVKPNIRIEIPRVALPL